MGSCLYTISQLLSLRPSSRQVCGPFKPQHAPLIGSYLSLIRKYQALLAKGPDPRADKGSAKLVRKYQIGISNKKFKRQWLQDHGTTAGLKNLPRFDVWVKPIRVVFIEEHIRALNKLLLAIDRLRDKVTYLINPSVSARPSRSMMGNVGKGKPSPKALSTTKYFKKRVAKVITRNDTNYLRVIGGLTYSIKNRFDLPPRGKDKYWYFQRTRGYWHASEHHPYGDEHHYTLPYSLTDGKTIV